LLDAARFSFGPRCLWAIVSNRKAFPFFCLRSGGPDQERAGASLARSRLLLIYSRKGRIESELDSGGVFAGSPLPPGASLALEVGGNLDFAVRCTYPYLLGVFLVD